MFEWIKKRLPWRHSKSSTEILDVAAIGEDLDFALQTYAQLLENECRDQVALDAALERIADLRDEYQKAKLETLAHWSA